MSVPLFPNVPKLPGVPALRRGPVNSSFGADPLLTGDTIDASVLQSTAWGIYAAGARNPVINPDTIVAFSYSSEYRLADYPLQRGGFETYDKVTLPEEVRVVMTKGGRLIERQAFLATVASLKSSLDLYDVVTPEATYSNLNFQRVSFERTTQSGAGMLTVEVIMREIRQTAVARFSNSKTASAASVANNGSVQLTTTQQTAAGIQ